MSSNFNFEQFEFTGEESLSFSNTSLFDSLPTVDSPVPSTAFLEAEDFAIATDTRFNRFAEEESPPALVLNSLNGLICDRTEIRLETYHMSGGSIDIFDPESLYPAHLDKLEDVEIEVGFVSGYSTVIFTGKILEIIRIPPDITRVKFIDHSVAMKNSQSTGSANSNDGSSSSASSGSTSTNFNGALDFILEVEGECSDHPADYGGRTFKGITEARARSSGFTGDVCTMPDDMIRRIYKEDYWDVLDLDNMPFPVALAAFNTSVNSGPGKAREFLAAMPNNGSDYEKAMSIANAQEDYYRAIVRSNPSQEVFINGWINRSNHLKEKLGEFQ